MSYDPLSLPKIRWGHMYKAGTVFELTRPHLGGPAPEPTIFVLLQDRCITPEDVMADEASAWCLILTGHVYDVHAGGLVLLKGLIDAAEEVA